MTPLLLFDIDMTLIRTTGAGRLAMERAFEELFGVPRATEGMHFDGRTDYGIFLEALRRFHAEPESRVEDAFERYLQHLPSALGERSGEVMPGVRELLETLGGRRAAMGLATGNIRMGAEAKLRHFELWEHFRGGGFGERTQVRSELVVEAIVDIARHHGVDPDPASAIVIGDTPLDIEAAHAAGARAMGVATGRFSVAELLAAGADMAAEDLSDTAGILELLYG